MVYVHSEHDVVDNDDSYGGCDDDDDGCVAGCDGCGSDVFPWDMMMMVWVVVVAAAVREYYHRYGSLHGGHQQNGLLLRGWYVGYFVGSEIVVRVDVAAAVVVVDSALPHRRRCYCYCRS